MKEMLKSYVRHHPRITKNVLDASAFTFRALNRKQPEAFNRIASLVNHLVKVKTVLGNGMPITVVWNDVSGYEICKSGWYECPTVNIVRKILRKGMTFIDVGANIGQYSMLAAGMGCEVYAFEPAMKIFQILVDNVNSLTIKAESFAVDDVNKTMTLFIASPDNLGATSLANSYCSTGETEKVKCITLDDYVAENNIPQVDALKIDVEGAETAVLKGAENLIARHHPYIVIEFEETAQQRFGKSCSDLEAILAGLGYQLYRITDCGAVPYSHREHDDYSFNVVAVSAAAHEVSLLVA